MNCPTCDHAMHYIGENSEDHSQYHCPRCGTLLADPEVPKITTPTLVERCRRFESLTSISRGDYPEWNSFGIAEAVNPPEKRST